MNFQFDREEVRGEDLGIDTVRIKELSQTLYIKLQENKR